MTAERALQIQERQALIERLQAMPAEMRERPQWLLWRFVVKPDAKKPAKMPYYVNGCPRGWPRGRPNDGRPTERQPQVDQGHELDRACLATLDQVIQRLQGSLQWEGAGFAFLPGDGLIGIDVDGAVDRATGELSELCRTVVEACESYTELSPSGAGVHVIVKGDTETFKSDDIGLEVYCGRQYFTCTGRALEGTAAAVQDIAPEALAWMRQLVEKAKAEARARREADRQAERAAQQPAAAAAPSAPAAAQPSGASGADDFRRVNDAALSDVHAWVPRMFSAAKTYKDGYRITSKDLGRNLQEDLQITPDGVMDFGEERGMSPIDVVMAWQPGASTPKDALHWLADALGITLAKPRRPGAPRAVWRPGEISPPPPQDSATATAQPGGGVAEAADVPPADTQADGPPDADPPPPGEPEPPAAADSPDASDESGAKAADKGKKGKKYPPEFWERLDFLRETFALIYGTDTVYDGSTGKIMTISNMSHAWGSELVRFWKNSTPCSARSEGGRWTVLPERVVFDPTGQADPDTHINLFQGFALQPVAGDVMPFLELLKHLCSRVAEHEEDVDKVMHYFLCWMAYPLQHPGSKLKTAVIMHGDEGAGKNFLMDLLVEIYGQYGCTVGQDELEDKFNDWRSRKLLVVGDEVSSRAELVHNKNRLKALITSTTVQINPKNLPRREEANHINVAFLSNELQPMALDNSDRRYLVIYTPKAREVEFYKALGKWKAEGGAAKVYHYLLTYECDGFDPYAPAPITSAKRDLIELNRKSPERFWAEWHEGLIDLPYWSCAGDQLYRAYLKYCQRIGERFPVQRELFTRMVMRMSDTSGKPMSTKPMEVDFGTEGMAENKLKRFLLIKPFDERPEEGYGAWATSAYHAFEKVLRKYLGHGFGNQAGADGEAP